MQHDYSDTVIDHFTRPRNVGEIADADGVGMIGSEECGDMIKVWIKVVDERLADVKYKVFGCPAAIAACSMMTELAMGMHVDEAWDLTDDEVAEALGGLPAAKYHCSNLAASALHEAIVGYIRQGEGTLQKSVITLVVDDAAMGNFKAAHGLAMWIEHGGKRILFDTGADEALGHNARLLGIDLTRTDAVVLSHGHYDHTGGLERVLGMAPDALVYVHPAALGPKFSQRDGRSRYIGMSDAARDLVRGLADAGRVVWTEKPAEVAPGLLVTGPIPRETDFEDNGGAFYVDAACGEADALVDDQAMVFDLPQGSVVLLGCAHAGVVNTLNHAAVLTGGKAVRAVIGGMHLLNASAGRLERTIDALGQRNLKKVAPAHCTGAEAVTRISEAFGERCFTCFAGARFELG